MRPRFVMLLFFIMVIMVVSCSAPNRAVRKDEPVSKSQTPSWFSKTIIPQGEFIFSVGHSQPRETEQEAKDNALAKATEEFVRYCKVDVQSFDRSIEVYSKEQGKEFSKSSFEAQGVIRARAFVSRALPEDWYVRKEKGKFLASVLLKVPKEEFDRIVNEKNIKLSLDVLFYYEGEDGRMQILNEGDVLKSGDGYAIYVKPSDSCYLYVYQVDALGKSFRLFPNQDFETVLNPLPPAGDLWIPNATKLFTLDETTGKEYFYIFASPDKMPDFEGQAAVELTKKDIDNVVGIKKMGVAGVKQKSDTGTVVPPKKNQAVAEVKRKLQAEGAFVYETWFWHK
ncbi:MAG: DUF4384 domain-containing protein [Proteobacteria bacterium]|nr:DUF4384 domain-containing protein [Pseudomonadota bacterium]